MASNSNELIKLVYQEAGNKAGQIFQEIYFLLGLRKGGIIRNGEKWIFKKADDLAERFNLSERTVRRHLNVLVEQGWLKREKHRAKSRRDQTYFYALGQMDKFEALQEDWGDNGKYQDELAQHGSAFNQHRWYALGDASKSRLEPEELNRIQAHEPDQLQPDKPAACTKEPKHKTQHSSDHRAARPKTERPKKIKKKAEHQTGQATQLPDQLSPNDLKAAIAAARAQSPLLQRKGGGGF